MESSLGIPEHFHLVIPDRDAPRPCKLVRQLGKELRLEFEQPGAIRDGSAVVPNLPDANLYAQFLNRKMREHCGVTEEQAAAHPAYRRMIAKALNADDENVAPQKPCGFFSERDSAARVADTRARDVRIRMAVITRVHCDGTTNDPGCLYAEAFRALSVFLRDAIFTPE